MKNIALGFTSHCFRPRLVRCRGQERFLQERRDHFPPSSSSTSIGDSTATDSEALNKINAAILGSFGGKDQGIPPESVKMFEATLKQLGKRVEIKIYPDAGHGFENPNNKAGYRPDDAAMPGKERSPFWPILSGNKKRPLIAIGIRRLQRARSHK